MIEFKTYLKENKLEHSFEEDGSLSFSLDKRKIAKYFDLYVDSSNEIRASKTFTLSNSYIIHKNIILGKHSLESIIKNKLLCQHVYVDGFSVWVE